MDREKEARGDLIRRLDSHYRREDHVFGIEPSAGIKEALPFLVSGKVLDLGSGDGRNALFLAHQGFDVTAVDIAPTAISNLTRYAARSRLQSRVKGVVADIERFEIEGPFENIVSTFTLHFLPKEAFLPVLSRIMRATAEGGINVIEDFTRDGPLFAQATGGYWLESGELRRLYEEQGWRVLYYDERIVSTKATDPQGNPFRQGAAAIVASRPSAGG
jgi:tellurite methyltransferase